MVEAWPSFTDNSIVSASVSYKLEKEIDLEESHLPDSGHRLKRLNFTKAPWPEIRNEFRKLDWKPTCEGKKVRNRMARKRNLIGRKLKKIHDKIQSSSSI